MYSRFGLAAVVVSLLLVTCYGLKSFSFEESETLAQPLHDPLSNPRATGSAPQDPDKQQKPLDDYNTARWAEIHRQPAILEASNEDCLKCHQEILKEKVLPETKAGLKANETLAWYQTLDTYQGEQMSFHWRHLESPYAKEVMNLKCNFCHQGNDPREEAPTSDNPGFNLRKMVDVKETCLKCHGSMNWEVMNLPAPMPGPWPSCRDQYQNDCLSCHAVYRSVRHHVSYLNAARIEELAKPGNLGGDVCYGCHGGRAWYRESYPYPRHEYPVMSTIPEPQPEWAKDRPTKSDLRYALPLPVAPQQPSTTPPTVTAPAATTPAATTPAATTPAATTPAATTPAATTPAATTPAATAPATNPESKPVSFVTPESEKAFVAALLQQSVADPSSVENKK